MAIVWFVLAGGLVVAELMTLTVVLSAIAVAAAIAGVVALLDGPVVLQLVVFAAAAPGLAFAAHPLAKRLKSAPGPATGVAALLGRPAVVTDVVTEAGGRVQLGGESWAARPLDPTRTYISGTSVVVAEVNGATVVVYDSEDL